MYLIFYNFITLFLTVFIIDSQYIFFIFTIACHDLVVQCGVKAFIKGFLCFLELKVRKIF